MSANIKWKIEKPEGRDLEVAAPSAFINAMERAFGSVSPWTIGSSDLPKLEGMAAVWGGDTMDNPFLKLCMVIQSESSSIRVWAEY